MAYRLEYHFKRNSTADHFLNKKSVKSLAPFISMDDLKTNIKRFLDISNKYEFLERTLWRADEERMDKMQKFQNKFPKWNNFGGK